MSLLTSLSSRIVQTEVPSKMSKAAKIIGNPSPKYSPWPLIPLETAVIAGRSAYAYKRDGFMELQERLVEEVVGAAIWLFGVSFMAHHFDNFMKKGKVPESIKKLLPKHLDYALSWRETMPKSLELAPLQKYTRDAVKKQRLQKFLTLPRMGITVFVPILAVGALVPWLTQVKTNLILKWQGKQKDQSHTNTPKLSIPIWTPDDQSVAKTPFSREASRASRSELLNKPVPTASTLRVDGSGLFNQPLSAENYQAPYIPIQGVPAMSPAFSGMLGMTKDTGESSNSPDPSGKQVKFGSWTSSLSTLGRFVHNETSFPYGQVVIIDTGITAGRSGVAAMRSFYETIEVLFREIASLYFYIWFMPLLASKINQFIAKPLLKTSILIEPEALGQANKKIAQLIGNDKASLAELVESGRFKEALYGLDNHTAVNDLSGKVASRIRATELDRFSTVLRLEGQEYLKADWTDDLARAIEDTLGHKKGLHANDVDRLVKTIRARTGAFNALNANQVENLCRSVQQAFRHTAGLSIEQFRRLDLPKQYEQELIERFTRIARQDSLDTVNSMFRRLMLISGDNLPVDAAETTVKQTAEKLWQRTEATAQLLEQIAVRRLDSLSSGMDSELKNLVSSIQKRSVAQVVTLRDRPIPNTIRPLMEKLTHALDGSPQELHQVLDQLSTAMDKAGGKHWTGVADQVRQLQGLIDPAVSSFEESIGRQLGQNMRQLGQYADTPDAFKFYQESIEKMLSGKNHRIVSLLLGDADKQPELMSKINELLRGGLVNDSETFRALLDEMGELPNDARTSVNDKKMLDARKAYTEYLEHLYEYAKRQTKKKVNLSLDDGLAFFRRRTHWTRLGVLGASLVTAMYAIGAAVPKAQYWITRVLTGTDEHPGIAAAEGNGPKAKAKQQVANAETSMANLSRTPQSMLNPGSSFSSFYTAQSGA